jgi:pyruvate, orthophosphate dikinase
VTSDNELSAEDLERLVAQFKEIVASHVTADEFPELAEDGRVNFPQDVQLQLRLAIEAVFKSWMNRRAIDYRRLYRIPDDLGTAVNVQTMVFGNKG